MLFDSIIESTCKGLLKISLTCITHELNMPSTKLPPSGKNSILILEELDSLGRSPESKFIIEIRYTDE
ncbi:hypothetical protein A9200_12030 [Maribacter hydrothermalis]|uniref:Uncharacterized protein n=1 Tax=Maribacter hydrothermalis TaxID=1836467 RepID=A0A1B7YXS1_9FLAO|nr:hypothetical protein A9200_12030 [Maribacter hydrothermalis]